MQRRDGSFATHNYWTNDPLLHNCGLDAATPNQYFGGCVGNATAGTFAAAVAGGRISANL